MYMYMYMYVYMYMYMYVYMYMYMYIPVDRMSEIIPYIQRCQKYLLHCPAYSLRNEIHL